MAALLNGLPNSLMQQMVELTLSDENKKIMPLEDYFPPSFKIHDYNPTEDKIIKTSFLNDDVKTWLRKADNKNFVFQCLLCCQEMTFSTVFLRGDYALNRSHLLTKKHKNRVKNAKCAGVLFVSAQKFIMCLESVLNTGNIFNAMKTVKRKNELLISNLIQNKIFCYNYSMYTFDKTSKSLKELDIKTDLVDFMINHVRPLFTFYCFLCDIKSGNFSQVVSHLGGKKHIKKLKGSKGVIISIRDFNVFVACKLDELSSFLFLDHINSYLEEIVIASAGTILVSGNHSKEGKQAPKDGGIVINVKPIELPNGEVAHKSIRVTTRYHNFLTDSSENENAINKLTTTSSRITNQQNVTIYEYSNQDFEKHFMDNIIHALFTIGCRIWCSRCKKGIFTLPALQTHLSSGEHNKNMRSNEQIGFMCHVCKIFFIELKGESLAHTHSSYENKNIIRRLANSGINSLEFKTPLNNSIIEVYGDILDSIGEACKFCCLACCDFSSQKLMYLSYHEISSRHKNIEGTLIYTYCEYCNVIYIDNELEQSSGQFKLHFAKHLNDSKGPITYQMYYALHGDNHTGCISSISNNFFSFKNIELHEETELSNTQILSVSFSRNFTQFDNPGVGYTEFSQCEYWNNHDFFKYLKLYTILTGKKVELFQCISCNMKIANKSEIFKHLFTFEHQSKQLIKNDTFLKVCDICNLAIFTGSIRDLQLHFNHLGHIQQLSRVLGMPDTNAFTFNSSSLSSFLNISRSSLTRDIERITCEMKETYRNRDKIFGCLTRDILALMSSKFPDLTVTFYGSRESGLATTDSDFDIFLNLGNDHLKQVTDVLDTSNDLFKLIVCLSDCAVPIIRAEHKPTKCICEFNLNNPGYYVHTSKIIKILTDLDERVYLLLAAVKHWSIVTKIRGTSMFSSHAITWLVLFYLMQPALQIIPNISFVIDLGDLDHDGDKGWFSDWKPKINKDKTWLELLEGFFNYYALMRFSQYKLYPSSGLVIPRVHVAEEDHPMFMQDPFYQDRNILFNATKEKCDKLTAACYYSLHLPWRLND